MRIDLYLDFLYGQDAVCTLEWTLPVIPRYQDKIDIQYFISDDLKKELSQIKASEHWEREFPQEYDDSVLQVLEDNSCYVTDMPIWTKVNNEPTIIIYIGLPEDWMQIYKANVRVKNE